MSSGIDRENLQNAHDDGAAYLTPYLPTLQALADSVEAHFGFDREAIVAVLGKAFLKQARQVAPADPAVLLEAMSRPGIAADIVLAAAYREGHAEALQSFERQFRGLVRFLAGQRLPRQQAVEAECEIWSALWEKIHYYNGRTWLKSWLGVVVRHWCFERKAREVRPGPEWGDADSHEMLARLPAADVALDTKALCEEFGVAVEQTTVNALRALEPPERALLRLRLVHRMPLEETRLRPEIYMPGEEPQPLYGITRRVQRASRKVERMVLDELGRRGYAREEFRRLVDECAGAAGQIAKIFSAELQNELQNEPPAEV
jgi:DNA-directed RNA polymerase specialized sigma24 family protein